MTLTDPESIPETPGPPEAVTDVTKISSKPFSPLLH
jgi:hypothetical protein